MPIFSSKEEERANESLLNLAGLAISLFTVLSLSYLPPVQNFSEKRKWTAVQGIKIRSFSTR